MPPRGTYKVTVPSLHQTGSLWHSDLLLDRLHILSESLSGAISAPERHIPLASCASAASETSWAGTFQWPVPARVVQTPKLGHHDHGNRHKGWRRLPSLGRY